MDNDFCSCSCWFECLRTVSIILNDNAINHSSPTNMRLLQLVVPVTTADADDTNMIPPLRSYSCFGLKIIKKQRSTQIKNDYHYHYRRYQCHQKQIKQNNDNQNIRCDVAPQMPKRLSSEESLVQYEFMNDNTIHNTNHNYDVHQGIMNNNKNCKMDNYQENDKPIHTYSSSNTLQVIHFMNDASYRCFRSE